MIYLFNSHGFQPVEKNYSKLLAAS